MQQIHTSFFVIFLFYWWKSFKKNEERD